MKKTVLLFVLLTAMAGGGLGVKAWRRYTSQSQEERAFNRAELFLQQGRPVEALAIHQFHSGRGRSEFDWAGLEFRALVAQVNLPRLTSIFLEHPERVYASEEGSLTVARAFLHLRQASEFESIRSKWRGRETDATGWLLLDADQQILAGRPADAEALLQKARLASTNDAPRLLRLALLKAVHHPTESVRLLDEAATLAPRQPDARVFRGQALEALGRPAEARVEFVAAVVSAPQNPLWRDQLAEHYRRTGALDLALATWREALPSPSLDAIWLKATFWSRMLQPIDFRGLGHAPPTGRLAPLVALLQSQPEDRFLDTNALEHLPAGQRLGADRPEVFWLQISELLRLGNEAGAWELLAGQPTAAAAWAADLQRGLLRVLAFRATGHLQPPGIAVPASGTRPSDLHSLFRLLENAALPATASGAPESRAPELPADVASLLRGEHAFAAVFLAAGWREAALRVATPDRISEDVPEWFTYGLAQALRYNRSPKAALAFLATRSTRPALALLHAEIQMTQGEREASLAALQKLATLDADAGFRAAWLLAIDALDQKRPAAARDHVEAQPRLAHSVTGRELLAKILIAEGKAEAADALYAELASQSIEAKSFLARTAFARQDWAKARRWTEELLAAAPDSVELRANLDAIVRAETGATP